MNNDVNDFLDKCEHCAWHKPRLGLPKPPQKAITATRIFERIEIDFTSFECRDPTTGDQHVLTVVDCFSKFAWAKAFPTQEAALIARWMFDIFLNEQKFPEIIQSDNGKSFLAEIVKELIEIMKAWQINSRPWHPQTIQWNFQTQIERACERKNEHCMGSLGTDSNIWI